MKKFFPILVSGILLIIFDFSVRLLKIYSFWESGYIGWFLIICFSLVYLFKKVKVKKREKKRTWLETIGIGILSLVVIVQLVLVIVIPRSDAYAAAKAYLSSDQEIINELGGAHSFFVGPLGTINLSSGPDGSTGDAQLIVIAKGDKKYGEFELTLVKTADKEAWEVVEVGRRW